MTEEVRPLRPFPQDGHPNARAADYLSVSTIGIIGGANQNCHGILPGTGEAVITGKIPPECHTAGELTITGRLPELRGQERPHQVTQISLQPPRGELRIEKRGTSKGLERNQ